MSQDYKCPECGDCFDSRRGLHIHIGEMHQDKKEDLFKEEKKINSERREKGPNKKIAKKTGILAITMLIIVSFYLFLDSSPAVTRGEEITPEEAGDIIVERFIENSELSAEETKIVNTKKTESDVYKIELDIGQDSIDVFTTHDGTVFFVDVFEKEEQMDINNENAGEIVSETIEENLEAEVYDRPQFRELSVEPVENEIEKVSNVYKVPTLFSASGVPDEKIESYITSDGRFVFLEGHSTNDFSEITIQPG